MVMKYLIPIVVFIGLCTNLLLAQPPIGVSHARNFKGQLVYIGDTIKKVRVITPSRVYITLGKGVPDSCVTVILTGKGAKAKAKSLMPYIVSAKGHIALIGGKPYMTVSDFKRIGRAYCSCLRGDPQIDIDNTNDPSVLTDDQEDALKNIISNRYKDNEPGIPLASVMEYLGHYIYIRDSIVSYKQLSKATAALYMGSKYPNQVLTIIITGEVLNDQNAQWRKKGIGRFYGMVSLFDSKPVIEITSKDQIIIGERK